MTATAYSIQLTGYTNSTSLFVDLVNIFKGTYTTVSATTGYSISGSLYSFFSSYPSITDQLSPAATLSAFLQSTLHIDSYLSTDSSQTYNLLLSLVTATGLLTISYGTDNNFVIPTHLTDATNVNPGPLVCPTVNILGPAAVVNASSGINIAAGECIPTNTKLFNLSISLTNRGFALACWRSSHSNTILSNSFLCIQRPVDPTTGIPKAFTVTPGDAPIFSLNRNYDDNGTTGLVKTDVDIDYKFNFSTIRSISIPSSQDTVSTTENPSLNSADNSLYRPCLYRQAMDWNHPNLFDNFTHVIKFPYGFFTTYHLYLDEMDLICFVNGMAFVTGQPLTIAMYGETLQRTYVTAFGQCQFASVANVTGSGSTSSYQLSRIATTGARIGLLTDSKDFH